MPPPLCLSFFFFNDTATTEIYTLSLHDALPIYGQQFMRLSNDARTNANLAKLYTDAQVAAAPTYDYPADRKSTRLNSSHSQISYAVFCLKKKKNEHRRLTHLSTTFPSHADARYY